jgi:hypothetical protein
MTRSVRADGGFVTSPRALALFAGFASPVFLVAAVAGWLSGLWPANPITLGVAAVAVIAGPLLGTIHVAGADRQAGAPPAEQTTQSFIASIEPDPILTPRAASARQFHNWRDSSNPVLERRERERRANQYLRA